uniref:Uncharacterized protein n=1 Tax=Catagonus wagneri TaxID=51154 RepID=A0A8C3WGA2_9CETA
LAVQYHQSTAWQVITGGLGILCVVLMTTVGVLLANCNEYFLLFSTCLILIIGAKEFVFLTSTKLQKS